MSSVIYEPLVVGGAFYLNLIFSKIRYNKLLYATVLPTSIYLFLARLQLYTPLLVMHS